MIINLRIHLVYSVWGPDSLRGAGQRPQDHPPLFGGAMCISKIEKDAGTTSGRWNV
jgi:hypothetical protein